MDYCTDWIWELYEKYVKENENEPVFLSNWDCQNKKLLFPDILLENSINVINSRIRKYLYSEDLTHIKKQILKLLISYNVPTKIESIVLTVSSTASIYLVLNSLNRMGIKRFLVITPVYYTIQETLTDLNANIVYYHLVDKDNFEINIDQLEELINNQYIEAVIFSDPIYCTGIEIKADKYEEIADLCKKHNLWLICDYSLGGLEWENNKKHQYPEKKLQILNKVTNFVYIDSISKRLLLNGLKVSTILTNSEIARKCEDMASQVYGGFTSLQAEFLYQVYSMENSIEINNIIQSNNDIIKANYELVTSVLLGSNYKTYKIDSGFFTMIYSSDTLSREVNSRKIMESFLFEFGAFAFPAINFSFYCSNKFSFRINIANDLVGVIPVLNKCIGKDLKSFHHFC